MTSVRQSASNAITNPEKRKSAKLKMPGEYGYESSSSSKRSQRRKFKSRLDARQQKYAALTVVILTFFVFTAMVTSPYPIVPTLKIASSSTKHHLIRHDTRPSNMIRGNNKNKPIYHDNCVVARAVQSDHPVTPTFTASFPGSGARVFWQLIEALTGLKTGDDFTANGDSDYVSIKTHYPSHEGRLIPRNEKIPHAILLVRHPMHAFPAYFRRLYRYLNQSPEVNYPPVDKWIEWRNDNFDRQLQVWRRHTEYWMDHYSKTDRLVVTYEKLVDEVYGADEALRVAEFLDRSEGVSSFPPDDVPCVWRRIINPKEGEYHTSRRLQEVEVIDGDNETGVGVVQNEVIQNETVQNQGVDIAVVDAHVDAVKEQGEGGEVRVGLTQPSGEDPQSGTVLEVEVKHEEQDVPVVPKKTTESVKGIEIKYLAPFNKRQLRDVIQILTQLLERYRDDRGLAPILVSYIDEVAQRSKGPPEDKNPILL